MPEYTKGDSPFLASLVKFLNASYIKQWADAKLGGQRTLPFTELFYNAATLESPQGPKDGPFRINPDNQPALDPNRFKGTANAIVGAFQVTTYLGRFKTYTPGNTFSDDYFIQLMLNFYGNIKVFPDGPIRNLI